VDELEGVAEGAGVPFAALFVLNCGEELTAAQDAAGGGQVDRGALRPDPARATRDGDRCTAVAVTIGDRHVIGHNMDWYAVDAANNVLFDLTVLDGTRLMGIAAAPYLLMLGMNSHGIGNVSTSVYSTDDRVGVPNAFVRRWALEAGTLEEARARGLLAARARGTDHFLMDAAGRLWSVETSATAAAFEDRTTDRLMAHTNHYVSPEMRDFEGSAHEESRVRLATAERLLREGVERGADPVELVARVLRCHEPSPDRCICGHADESRPAAQQTMTVGSMICDLDERRVYACAGPPCESPYSVFEMGDVST
jgi:isopenicillin-N N-acyltransferase-like protein